MYIGITSLSSRKAKKIYASPRLVGSNRHPYGTLRVSLDTVCITTHHHKFVNENDEQHKGNKI